jgi:hypothetical protein
MIYGNWYCRSYDWSLELAGDGEYVSEFAEGRSVGRYFLDGYLITFQDAYTAEVATYTFEFAGDVLELIIGERVSEEEGGELLDAWITGFREDQAGFKEKLGEWTAARFIVTLRFWPSRKQTNWPLPTKM